MIQSNTNQPMDYEKKFADFIEMCRKARQNNVSQVVIARPQILGDTYDEIIESLSRLAEAKLSLTIASR